MTTRSEAFTPERLVLAREFRGHSKASLSKLLGCSRQYVHQLENGIRTPNDELLAALSELLGFNREFFFLPMPSGLGEGIVHFRALKSARQKTKAKAMAHAKVFELLVLAVSEEAGLPEVDFPRLSADSPEEAEQAAATCRRHWNLTANGPIMNMVRVVENAGAVVANLSDIGDKKVDAFSSRGAERPVISMMPDRGSPTRARLSMAHEVGHLVLHSDAQSGADALEVQANRFAAAFLLPRSAFLTEFTARSWLDWHAMFKMKARWGVSVQAIVHRAYELGCIDYRLYKRANIHISSNGWRKRGEPYEPSREQPELFPAAIRALQDHRGIEVIDLARKSAMTLGTFEDATSMQLNARSSPAEAYNVVPFPRPQRK
jgi:Zn-dependent peptidase ImmA (M78 family)/DNA-binding XRE family transcriptional regulator